VVYLLGFSLLKSLDGGKTFNSIAGIDGFWGHSVVHADMQAMWIDPHNPQRLLLGNDGGFNISYDAGETWQKISNLPLAQCYTIHYDLETPYRIYTGLQDNGVNRGFSNFQYGSRDNIWTAILAGDGAFVQPEPGNANTVYAEYQFGYIYRLDLKEEKNSAFIRPAAPDPKNPYRFNWLSPFLISHFNPYTIYMGANKVLKTIDKGEHWQEISPDLTDQKNIHGDVPYATIVSLDESPVQPGLLYAGTDDGNLWVLKNTLSGWEKINQGLPKKWVTRITASKYKKERVYITQTGYREDDFSTYVFGSEDYGRTWSSIKANLPDEPVNVIREDPVNENILYLGTDLGIYVTLDRGQNWFSLKNNLPTNAVYDLRVHPRENQLIIGTHGRGVFLLPVKLIQAMTPELKQKPLHLMTLTDVFLSRDPFSPQEPMTVWFYSNTTADMRWEILDKNRKSIESFTISAIEGINRWTWTPGEKSEDSTGKKWEKGEYTLVLKKGEFDLKEKFKLK